MSDINITGSLDDRDIVAAFNRMIKLQEKSEARYDALAKAAKDAGDKAKKMADDAGDGLQDVVDGVAAWGTGLLSVSQGLSLISTANQKLLEDAAKVAREYDGIFRSIDALSGISGPEAEGMRKKVMEAAKAGGTNIKNAALGRQALEGAGFSTEEASGAALKALLQGQAALGARDQDPSGNATAIAGYLDAMKMDKTAENVTEIYSRLQTMNPTNMNIESLQPLAKNAAGLTSVPIEQQFGAYSTILATGMPHDQGATALARIVSRLQTQKENKSAQKGFKALGINNDDVDLIGPNESLFQAVRDIGTAYNKLPAGEARESALKNIIGDDHMAAFLQLMNNPEMFQKNMEIQKNRSGYQAAVVHATGGINAAHNRLDTDIAEKDLANYQQDDLIDKQRELMFRERGEPAAFNYLNSGIYKGARYLGASQEWAHWMSAPLNMPFSDVQSRVQQNLQGTGKDPEMSEQTKAIKEQTQVLQGIRSDLAKPNAQQVTPPVLNSGKPTR